MKKNEISIISITGTDADGFGIGRNADGFTVFVEGALPGERVRVRILKVKPRYAYAKIEKILTPSPHRLSETRCPEARRCGGCQWQHCDYSMQLDIKKRAVTDALIRIGRIPEPPVADVLGMDDPFHYRNKSQFPVGAGGIGFYAPRSHRIVPVAHCAIQHPSHEAVLSAMREYIQRYHVPPYDETTHTGLLRHIVMKAAQDELMVVPVINGSKLPREEVLAGLLTEAGATTVLVNTHKARSNTVIGTDFRVLTGDGFIRERIGDITYRLSARAFFQVNPIQTKVLYDTALVFGGLTGKETILDAHAGVGGIALYAAGSAGRVYGVEIVPEAVADARYNAALNAIDNTTFICGAAEAVIPALLTGEGLSCKKTGNASPLNETICPETPVHTDVIYLDPPRKGCTEALIDTIIHTRIPRVVYISCEPATLARDAKRLTEGGYQLVNVQPVDMFPQTGKVEVVALLTLTSDDK